MNFIFNLAYFCVGLVLNFLGSAKLVIWWFFNTPVGVVLRLLRISVASFTLYVINKRHYKFVSKKALQQRKTGDRIFIFGSGSSLNELTEAEWIKIRKHDSFGFNGSFHLKKIKFTYLLIRAAYETVDGIFKWRPYADYSISLIDDNRYLEDTLFLFPFGLTSSYTNSIVGHRLWNQKKTIYSFFTDRFGKNPHKDLDVGLVQRAGTLCMAISCAYAMGYKDIVLIGVDLYDNRYFWVPEDKTLNWSSEENREIHSDVTVRGLRTSEAHNTVNNGIIEIIRDWGLYMQLNNVKLTVYNKKSLLTDSVETFSWD